MGKKCFVVRKPRRSETPRSQDMYRATYQDRLVKIMAKLRAKELLNRTEELRLSGKDYVTLCLPFYLWLDFVEKHCQQMSPNEKLTELITRSLAE